MVAELSGWDALWIALAGGAVATVLAYIGRFLAVPGEIESNDRAVLERDQDLESWLADENVRLKRRLTRIRNELAARGMFQSGEYAHLLNLAKERAIHAYRDQERQARRDVARIHQRENWMHGVWRQITLTPQAVLTVPVYANELLDAWATPPTKHLATGDQPVPLDDPRQRTLGQALDEVRQSVADFE